MIKIIFFFERLPCSPVVKTLGFDFRGLGFVPSWGNKFSCYADKTVLNNNNNFSVTEILFYFTQNNCT